MKLKHLKHTEEFDFYSLDKSILEKIPLFEGSVRGFPSPTRGLYRYGLRFT